MNVRLKISGLSYSYNGNDAAVEDVSLKINKGEFVGIVGPNGSGKSTLLKNLYRALTPDKGTIFLDGENLLKMKHKKSALKQAVVSQENDIPFNFLVEEIVAMGRSPHKKLFDFDNDHDKKMVRHALEHVGMENMAKRNYQNLSGGEKQRVLIARAIAQESDLFLLDEPANHLDIGYKIQIFDLVKRLKITVIAAIHDLNMASLYCDRIYVLKDGKIVLSGTPEEVFTEENIYNVYGVKSSVIKHSITGKISITFLPSGTIDNKKAVI